MRITADLEVWLVSDPEMSASWRQLARHLSLQSCIPRLEVTTRRKLRTDSDKLSEVLRIWRNCQPNTFNVSTLLRVLDLMGMKSMYEWIQLMTKERLDIEGVESFVTRCNTPHATRCNTPRVGGWSHTSHTSQPHSLSPTPTPSRGSRDSRPLSDISEPEELNSSFSHSNSSSSPQLQPRVHHHSGGVHLVHDVAHRHHDGGVFNTLYRPELMNTRGYGYDPRHPSLRLHNPVTKPSQLRHKVTHGVRQTRHSSYIAPIITLDSGTPSPESKRPSSILDQFDEAFAEYKQNKHNRNNVDTERYFDNLASLLREL